VATHLQVSLIEYFSIQNLKCVEGNKFALHKQENVVVIHTINLQIFAHIKKKSSASERDWITQRSRRLNNNNVAPLIDSFSSSVDECGTDPCYT
jgi:hypothetical protein